MHMEKFASFVETFKVPGEESTHIYANELASQALFTWPSMAILFPHWNYPYRAWKFFR
jgi:hypothetical protein